MKKIIAIGLLVLFVTAAFTSCKPRERCPAYGHLTTTEKPNNQDIKS